MNHLKLGPVSKMEFGFDTEINNTDYNYYRKLPESSVFVNEIQFDRLVSTVNYSAFITLKKNLFSRLIFSAGMRLDQNDYEKVNLISPRMNLDYELVNGWNGRKRIECDDVVVFWVPLLGCICPP